MKCLLILSAALLSCAGTGRESATNLEWIQVSEDGTHFMKADSKAPFRVWGVNYDHDDSGRLLEDYWVDEWQTVADDFAEIKALGANVVRIHLQFGNFMQAPGVPNDAALQQLERLLTLAESTRLYLDITGLGCYHKQDNPSWYDSLNETERWQVQAQFWGAVAKICANSPAVFCYDLMNEPIIGGAKQANDWLAGDFAGSYFVQRIALDLNGRSQIEIAKAWVETLTTAIRKFDQRHLITVGVIPWAHTWPNAKPVFYAPEVREHLDFTSVHFYPEAGELERALQALAVYEVGQPLIIEEMFPLKCSAEELLDFVDQSKDFADGWISFYWGKTIEECAAEGDMAAAILKSWLEAFRDHSKVMLLPGVGG